MFSSNELSDSCFDIYLELVYKLTGITIKKSRKRMLSGRVRSRMSKLEIETFENYLDYVRNNSSEEEHFVNVMTTNETYFYRTPRVWDFIIDEFLKKWDNSKQLNIWSGASSTGEEAHTLGIICENYKNAQANFQYQITGTDISTDVIKIAKKGCYKGRSVERFRQVRPDLFNKYMNGNDENGYKVLPKIRSNIHFKNHNLFNKFVAGEKFDLILLRNVLIYFTKEDQERVLENIHRHLTPNGYLIIGESESLTRLNTSFESVSPLIYSSKLSKEDKDAA